MLLPVLCRSDRLHSVFMCLDQGSVVAATSTAIIRASDVAVAVYVQPRLATLARLHHVVLILLVCRLDVTPDTFPRVQPYYGGVTFDVSVLVSPPGMGLQVSAPLSELGLSTPIEGQHQEAVAFTPATQLPPGPLSASYFHDPANVKATPFVEVHTLRVTSPWTSQADLADFLDPPGERTLELSLRPKVFDPASYIPDAPVAEAYVAWSTSAKIEYATVLLGVRSVLTVG